MIIAWAEKAWEDYLYWQATDKKTLQRQFRIKGDKNYLNHQVLRKIF